MNSNHFECLRIPSKTVKRRIRRCKSQQHKMIQEVQKQRKQECKIERQKYLQDEADYVLNQFYDQ